MRRIRLPANNWQPRPYQRAAWEYLEGGGLRASLLWHRRSGKDELCLHHTACAAMERVGNYWHMLPEAEQSRKAIWDAVNPATGRKRIDEAFPDEIRARINNQSMFIEFASGSTWQVLGSDNYKSLVGAPPRGIIFSEWSKAHPGAWAYLSPILRENGGWAVFATTPQGKNHAYNTHKALSDDPTAFAQILTAEQTGVFDSAALQAERKQLVAIYGDTLGAALYEQEYLCSFESAILGGIYAREIHQARVAGRIGRGDTHSPGAPVYTAWDLGRSDATAIWWYQYVSGEVRVLEYEEHSQENLDFYASRITGRQIINPMGEWAYGHHPIVWGEGIAGLDHRREYNYGCHYLPHDASQQKLENSGNSTESILRKALKTVNVIPNLGANIVAQLPICRTALNSAWFSKAADEGVEVLSNYRYAYDEHRMSLSANPVHDWSSHGADAWRVLSHAVAGMAGTGPQTRSRYQPARKPKRGSAWAA